MATSWVILWTGRKPLFTPTLKNRQNSVFITPYAPRFGGEILIQLPNNEIEVCLQACIQHHFLRLEELRVEVRMCGGHHADQRSIEELLDALIPYSCSLELQDRMSRGRRLVHRRERLCLWSCVLSFARQQMCHDLVLT